MNDGNCRDEIVRLEAQIDELAARIESCRKFILAGRIAVVGGSVVFIATVVGAIQFDPSIMADARPAGAAPPLPVRSGLPAPHEKNPHFTPRAVQTEQATSRLGLSSWL